MALTAEQRIRGLAEVLTDTCPRCGRKLGRRPALSRRISVSICSECGTLEALSDAAGIDDPIENWSFAQTKG